MLAETVTTTTTVVAQTAPSGGIDITPIQAVGAILFAVAGLIWAANKYLVGEYLPRRQENQAAERTAEREHEQSLVSKLTDQSADLQSKLFEVVTQRLSGIEQTTQATHSEVSKVVGQVESLASQQRTSQLELRELRGQIGGVALGSTTVEMASPPPNPRPKPRPPHPE